MCIIKIYVKESRLSDGSLSYSLSLRQDGKAVDFDLVANDLHKANLAAIDLATLLERTSVDATIEVHRALVQNLRQRAARTPSHRYPRSQANVTSRNTAHD